MRKLVYVGKDSYGNTLETSSFEEMTFFKAKGYTFTERLDNIKKEESDKAREKRLARIEKQNKARKEKA